MATLIIAALNARWLAEAAAREGHRVIALDAFGDRDTRAAASTWRPLPCEADWRISADALRTALYAALQQADEPVLGWIAGPGLEPALMAWAADPHDPPDLPPLIGNPPATVGRVRTPADFFTALQRLGLPHPATPLTPPADPIGWLSKDLHASGGWHICAAAEAVAGDAPGRYWQRQQPGASCSALFVANGRRAQLLALQRQDVRPLAGRPHVFHGVSGPLQLPAPLPAQISAALDALSAEFGLRGLNGLDFIADARGGWQVLEVNPRPSASLQLYPDWPLLDWHLRACLTDALPPPPAVPQTQRGWQIVYTPHAVQLDAAVLDALASLESLDSWPAHHDLPDARTAPLHLPAHAPLLSVSAQAHDADQLAARLATRAAAVLACLPPAP